VGAAASLIVRALAPPEYQIRGFSLDRPNRFHGVAAFRIDFDVAYSLFAPS
jgi:hypothetical protein